MAKKDGYNLIFLDSYRKKMNQDTAAATEHTDRESELKLLLSQISNGDEGSMRAFYQQTVRLVYSMSHKIISNPEEAEEVALEVFMYVWNNASKYDPNLSKPLSWLLMITRSRSIDRIRKSTKTVQIDDSVDDSMVTGIDNPEDTYIASEMRRITRYAMAQLTPKQKEVVELSYYHQYSHSEIADKVGAIMVADIAHVAGLVATGEYPSPVQIADVTTSTTHKTLRGPRSGIIMGKANEDIQKKINFMVFPAYQGGPHMHTIAAKAVAFLEAQSDDYHKYIKQVLLNAKYNIVPISSPTLLC